MSYPAGDPKPFLKWVGGKRQLLKDLHSHLPPAFDSFIEPFAGGAALMWSLSKLPLKNIVISDFNSELINAYLVVRDRCPQLIEELSGYENTEEFFYFQRDLDRSSSFKDTCPVKRAARFIFLNKTAFNGLHRVNSKGFFNTPYGRYKNPSILDAALLNSCSLALKKVIILTGDFEEVLSYVEKSSLVYLDPPYVPVSATSSFTSYSTSKADDAFQLRLLGFCQKINNLGAKFILSNSDCSFTRDLYKDFNIHEVKAARSINSVGSARGKISELLVKNF